MAFSILSRIVGVETGPERWGLGGWSSLSVSSVGSLGLKPGMGAVGQLLGYAFSILSRIVGVETVAKTCLTWGS